MKTRWKISLAVLVFLGLSLGVPLLTMHRGAENELAAYKKLLLAQGVKLKISEVMPVPVPADQNGADLVEEALKVLPSGYLEPSNLPSMMKMIAPGKAMIGWQQPDLRDNGEYGYTNSWENAAQVMEAVRPTVDLLRQAARFPALDFHLEYQKGPETPLPHLDPLRESTWYLSAMAVFEMRDGDPAAAVTNLCAVLALVQGWHDERTLFSQSARMDMAGQAALATWELLQTTNATAMDLAKLQKSWEQVEFVEALKNTFLMDQAMVDEYLVRMRESTAEYRWVRGHSSVRLLRATSDPWEDAEEHAQDAWRAVQEKGTEIIWQTSWGYSVELRFLKDMQEVMGALCFMDNNGYFQPAFGNMVGRVAITDEVKRSGINGWMDSFLGIDFKEMPASFSDERIVVAQQVMRGEASRRMIITAIALKRFQLRRGKFPEELSELVPEFLTVIPRDAVDGQPLRYRRNQNGTYLLYSIGDDGVDNGGDPTVTAGEDFPSLFGCWSEGDTRDWVWPQAATAAAVEKYYADEAAKTK